MVFSNVCLGSPGLGVESEGRKEEEGLRAWAENNSVSVFSYTKCIILSSDSRLTAWTEKKHNISRLLLNAEFFLCKFMLNIQLQMYYDRTSQNFKDVSNKEHVLYIWQHKPQQNKQSCALF